MDYLQFLDTLVTAALGGKLRDGSNNTRTEHDEDDEDDDKVLPALTVKRLGPWI